MMSSSDRASWDPMTTKTFIDLCINQKDLNNFNSMGLTKYGWQQVYRSFREQTGLDYDNKKLQNKLNLLRRSFQQWQYLQNHTGLGLEPRTGDIAADDSYWWTQEGDPSPQDSRGKPPPFLDELYTLFGRTTHDRGNLISAGGVREPLRSYGNRGTPDDGVGCSSKRIREATVDSPLRQKG
ncbi:hypothetical protein ZEAMMB73_Zm00001d043424 [Zea mays]|uniref:Myb/SANT-like domain-containing protein n=1 Tax=Zea mays TaxID=4577 RepID=A0A1D6NBM0_MAIZE|nr:hypothetical protein ZEAMMB73_Zm00001d043424 [Zea mays]